MYTAGAIQHAVLNVVVTVGNIGVEPSDDQTLRLRKAIASSAVLLAGIPIQLLYMSFYLLLDESDAAVCCLLGALIMGGSLLMFHFRPQRFNLFNAVSLVTAILSPFFITITLGGLVNSVTVMMWGLVTPLFAIIQYDLRRTLGWLAAYILAILVILILQPWLRQTNNIPFVVANALSALNMIGMSLLVFAVFLFFVSQRDLAHKYLEAEQDKSERLLLNILPREIATILKDSQGVVADHFDGASILFADVVDFTPLSAGMTPKELVDLLNEVFSYFDTLADKYGLEKIKTIGDCYMVAAGVPRAREEHAHSITRMALEMRDFIAGNTFCGRKLEFRIGINSGPVVAGVIGRKKFIYDLWGDAVNTASRMESNGSSGDIQITEATYELIKNEFECQPQGNIPVKGKGQMAVWYVIGEKPLDPVEKI